MKTLKNINRNEQSLDCSSLTPGRVQCEEDIPYFNSDYFSYVIVQTLKERDNIPCKLRQNGMIAIVIEERFAEYQLQTSLNSGICNNTSWKRIRDGHQNYDSSNLFLFNSRNEVDIFLNTPDSKAGQILYIITENKYYRVSKNKTLEDPFPEKLDKPIDTTQLEDEDLLIPVYKNGLPPLWKSYSDFGRIHTVNGLASDDNKNINIGIDEVLKVGQPKSEDTANSVASTKRVLLYDANTGKSYWKKVSEIGKINSVDNIQPIDGNVDLSSRYFTKTQIKDGFVSKPVISSNDQDLDIVLQNSKTGESFKIRLGDVPNLKVYKSPDKTLTIDDDLIYLNVSTMKYETEVLNYNQNMLPLDIQAEQEFAEITDVVVNGEILPKEMYRLTSKQSITILENYSELTSKYIQQPEKLYIAIKGIKFFNK